MHKLTINRILLILLAFTFIESCSTKQDQFKQNSVLANQKNVTFFGTGKVSRYQQHKDSSLEMLAPLFFAEIFITEGGEVKNASVMFPDPQKTVHELQYRYSESEEIGDVMYLSGLASTYEELEKKFPTGEYLFSFSTPDGDVVDRVVSYKDRTYPIQPIIIFKQDGKKIGIDEVNTHKDLIITWPPFTEGAADKNGLLDDPIFVAIDSCNVEDIVHSGRPFEKNDYLTFRTADYTVAANILEPGQTYSMYVEHAVFTDTQIDNGMPGFATFASSTYMDFTTTGDTDSSYCGEEQPK